MGQSVLLYTGATMWILLFASTRAQPISIFQILQLIQSAPKIYPEPVYAFSLCMEITNRVFNDSLLNPTTQEYKHIYAEVSGALQLIFNCSMCHTRNSYRGVKAMKFSKGSVVANCTVMFQTIFINNVVVKYLFLTAIENNSQPNGLEINKDFTKETVTPIWHFVKTTTPMAKTTPSALKASGGVSINTSRSKLSTTKPQSNESIKRTTAMSLSVTSQKLLLNTGLSGQRTTTAKRGSETQPAVQPTFLNSVANPIYKRVPGWAIALMVLACVTLLLIIIILIFLLCGWCFHKKHEATKHSEHAPYERTSFKEHLPTYSSHAPNTNHNFPVIGDPQAKNHGNRSGMYVVNPQR